MFIFTLPIQIALLAEDASPRVLELTTPNVSMSETDVTEHIIALASREPKVTLFHGTLVSDAGFVAYHSVVIGDSLTIRYRKA